MFSMINVEVNARLDRFENTMWKAADIADASMTRAAANADQFQSAFERASNGAGESADRMAQRFEAANDAVASSAQRTTDAIDNVSQTANKMDMSSWADRMGYHIGQGVGAGAVVAQTWLDKLEEFAKTKLILIGVAIATGITLGAATAIYAAYEVISSVVGFAKGLLTGDSYKSENIESIAKLNEEVEYLQSNFGLGAIAASALNQALKSSGVSAEDYKTAMDGASKAVAENHKELDRLGIKYKDTDGNILSQREILINARDALDRYREGYDRTAAAAAIGMGSYKQISGAISMTTEKVEESRQKLASYGLLIGENTQRELSKYSAAVKTFEEESTLTAQGFKKAISDNIMPILGDLADFFKDGWPTAVAAFRMGAATVTSILYGLKETFYVVSETILESMMAVGDVLGKLVSAASKAAARDYAGAWDEVKTIPDKLGERWDIYWKNLQTQSERNVGAMKLAWGFDNGQASATGAPKSGDDRWNPPPKIGAGGNNVDSYDKFIERLQRENVALNQNEYESLKLEAAQKALREGKNANIAISLIEERQILASTRALDQFAVKQEEDNAKLLAKRDAIGLVGIELDVYSLREQKRIEAISKINELQRSGKPLTEEATEAIKKQADASAQAAEKIMRQNAELSRSFSNGLNLGFKTYVDDAGNAAKQSQSLVTSSFSAMENAVASFATNGAGAFKNFANAIISDIIRIQVRMAIAGLAKYFAPAGGVTPDSNGSYMTGSQVNDGYANGGAFSSGREIVPFANGDVFATPTFFPMSNGQTGLLGEAGEEAIMPLSRGPDGKLGVKASGGSSAKTTAANVQVNVINNASADGYEATASQSTDSNGKDIITVLVDRVKGAMTDDVRKNGQFSRLLSAKYGLTPAM